MFGIPFDMSRCSFIFAANDLLDAIARKVVEEVAGQFSIPLEAVPEIDASKLDRLKDAYIGSRSLREYRRGVEDALGESFGFAPARETKDSRKTFSIGFAMQAS